MKGTTRDRDDTVMMFALVGLLGAGATNAAVAVLEAVLWAWGVAGLCLLAAMLCGLAWRGPDGSGPDGERAAWGGRGRAQQIQLLVGEVEPAALVRRDP